MFRESIMAFMGVKDEERQRRTDQKLGEYCRGKNLVDCRQQFGADKLELICSTCPD